MKTYILLMPIKSFERKEAELIENNVYDSIELLYGLHYGKGILIIELTDFMDLMNDQDDVTTDGDKYWMTYVQIKKQTMETMETINDLRVWTYFDGTQSDVNDFTREWETLLGTNVTADLTSNSDGGDSWYCEAFVNQQQIDEFNMDEDWFTFQ